MLWDLPIPQWFPIYLSSCSLLVSVRGARNGRRLPAHLQIRQWRLRIRGSARTRMWPCLGGDAEAKIFFYGDPAPCWRGWLAGSMLAFSHGMSEFGAPLVMSAAFLVALIPCRSPSTIPSRPATPPRPSRSCFSHPYICRPFWLPRTGLSLHAHRAWVQSEGQELARDFLACQMRLHDNHCISTSWPTPSRASPSQPRFRAADRYSRKVLTNAGLWNN